MMSYGKCRMNKLFIFSSLVFVAGLFGCRATPYQRLGTTLAGGCSEKVVSEDTFYIRFFANNHRDFLIVIAGNGTAVAGLSEGQSLDAGNLTDRPRFCPADWLEFVRFACFQIRDTNVATGGDEQQCEPHQSDEST